MKVAFDIKNLWLYGKGIGAFTINLLNDIKGVSCHPDTSIQLYAPSFEMEGLNFIHDSPMFRKVSTYKFNKRSKLDKVKYDQIDLLRSLRHNKPDILFSPYFDIPLLWQKPTITTIHDLGIFELKGIYSRAFYIYYKMLLQKAIKQSSFIVTVSNASRQKLIEVFNIPYEKVKVIYNKVPNAFMQQSTDLGNEKLTFIKNKYQLPNEYILYTGGLEKRKNIRLLIDGICNARKKNSSIPKLLITGVYEDKIPVEFKELLENENVLTLGFLPYEEVASLYSMASLIVNTSNYEGFGIPVLEALTLQKPMLCSDIPVYKEIGKEYVYYFKNNDNASFEHQLTMFFSGKQPSLDKVGMQIQADFFNKRNYSEAFFQMVNHSI